MLNPQDIQGLLILWWEPIKRQHLVIIQFSSFGANELNWTELVQYIIVLHQLKKTKNIVSRRIANPIQFNPIVQTDSDLIPYISNWL